MKTIKVGLGTCGVSAGGEKVYQALKNEVAKANIPVKLIETGCMGNCYQEVLLEINDELGVLMVRVQAHLIIICLQIYRNYFLKRLKFSHLLNFLSCLLLRAS